MLLETFAVDFLAFASGRLKASTLRDYRYCLASHIVPRLGRKHLHQLTTRDVLMLQSQLAATPARANRAVNITLRMLRVAAQLGHRVGVVERPKAFRERRRERYLTHAEALRLLQVLDREPSLGAVVIRLLLLTGMRRGEALGLKWDEVDAERSMLRLGDSKTGARVVPLSPDATGDEPTACSPTRFPWPSGARDYVSESVGARAGGCGTPRSEVPRFAPLLGELCSGSGCKPPGDRGSARTPEPQHHGTVHPRQPRVGTSSHTRGCAEVERVRWSYLRLRVAIHAFFDARAQIRHCRLPPGNT
jgi:Phage integrase family